MKKSFFTGLCLLVSFCGFAKVQLPDIISDNMVLQQNAQVKLWGNAIPNSEIVVKPSWSNKKAVTKSDSNGCWIIKIATPSATYEPQTISFSDGEKLELKNILIGEVWFCSGQSNMEMPLGGFPGCPMQDANDEILYSSQYKGIRCATAAQTAAVTPQTKVAGNWKVSCPENASKFSGTAFYFAKSLNKALDVPVGIINCSWGGSKLEGWLPKEILEQYEDINLSDAGNKEVGEYAQPMIMYNGMLKPLQNYTVRGFIWYQGESNIGRADSYPQRMATLVELWRKEWGLGELPFYYVEIAPYVYEGAADGLIGALLREAQYKAQWQIPNSGMISTNDLVMPNELYNIHPRNKQDVGKRLSFMALKNTYGVKNVFDRGPEYKSIEVEGEKAILSFENVPDGYNRMNGMIGFEIAGEDKVFHPAEARIHGFFGGKIEVVSAEVKKPVAVRYCFRNFQIGNVTNSRGLPMVPFRTDNW